MSIPLLDTFNIPTGILTSTTSELLLARDTDGDVKLFNGASYLRGSGTVNYLPVYSATNTLASSILLQTGGNIGIGLTTNIDHKLKVGGGIYGDYLQVNTAYSNGNVPGRFSWDSDHDLIELGLNNQFSAKLPQDEVWSCIAATTITKGQLVYASGTVGSSGKIQATPFIADGTIPARFLIGVATENAAQGESFHAMRSGILRGINTFMYTEGQDLWASITTIGGYQTTAPVAPNQKLSVAFVVASHAQNGELAIRINNGFELGGASDAQITSPTTNQLLRYNSNRWENWTHNFVSLSVNGTVNRIAKFTGATTLGNSLIQDDGTNVLIFGNIGIGASANSAISLNLRRDLIGSGTFGILNASGGFENGSDNIGIDNEFRINSNIGISSYIAFRSRNTTIPSGATNQLYVGFQNLNIAFAAASTVYSFQGQVSSGTNRWNLYMDGTAINYLRGGLLLNTTSNTGEQLIVNGNAKITTMATGTSTDEVVTVTSSGVLNKRTVTALLSDINGITGTGTTNRIAKFTGATTLGDSLIQDDANRVGIGALFTNTSLNIALGLSQTNSIGLLQRGTVSIVSGGDVIGVYNQSNISSSVTSGNYTHFAAIQGSVTGASLTNQTGFLAGFNLNLGTNNYGFRGLLSSATGRWNLYMDGTASNYLAGRLVIGTLVDFGLNTDNGLRLAALRNHVTPSTSGISIDTVGVFSNNASTNGNATVSILSRSSGTQRLNFGNQLVESASFISSVLGDLRFGTGSGSVDAVERMRLLASGSLGLGTTSPISLLELSNDSSGSIIKLTRPTLASNNLGVGAISFGDSTGYKAAITSRVSATNMQDLRFHTGTANASVYNVSERMRIESNGNLLIGLTIDGGQLLQVGGSIRQTSVTNNLLFADSNGVLTGYANTASIALGTGTGGYIVRYSGTGVTQNIGNSALFQSGSNIGLGKTNPGYTFDVNGDIGVSGTLSVYSGASSVSIVSSIQGVISTYINNSINVFGDTNSFIISNSNSLPSGGSGYRVQIDSGTTGGNGLFVRGNIYSTATITSFSDIRLKSELERIENAIDKIKKISGYTYLFNDKKTLGLISQEVKNIAPEAIEEKGGYMTLNYQGFSAVIVEAIKELSSEIQKLKEKCQ